MKVYYAPNTRAVRIVWLFEELGLPYDLERFKLGDAAMRALEYLKVHPMGRVPALQDGDVRTTAAGVAVAAGDEAADRSTAMDQRMPCGVSTLAQRLVKQQPPSSLLFHLDRYYTKPTMPAAQKMSLCLVTNWAGCS